jgi:hypothetical protein
MQQECKIQIKKLLQNSFPVLRLQDLGEAMQCSWELAGCGGSEVVGQEV